MATESKAAAAAATNVVWQRPEFSTVAAYLISDGAQKVIDFMTEVLGATTMHRIVGDDGASIRHAILKIGDTVVMIADGSKDETSPAFPVWLHVYVPDVDQTYELALKSGAVSVQAPKDECYGDRMGGVKDAAGNTWWIATHKFLPQCPKAADAAACKKEEAK